LLPGFTENPEPPSKDFFCAAVSSVLDDKGLTRKSYKWLLRAELVRARSLMAAQKLASIRREDATAAQKRAKTEQATLRVLFDAKKHRQSFYKF
jgi:5-bromo-4-chloroindolyl phosphate hydrolysis protein